MKKIMFGSLALVTMAAVGALSARIGTSSATAQTAPATAPAQQTRLVVAATEAFLSTLNADQKQKVSFPFAPQKASKLATFARSGGAAGGPGGGPGRGGGGPDGPGGGHRGPGAPGGVPQGRGGGGPGGGGMAGFVGEQYGQAVWSNYPVSDVPRPGLQMGSLSDTQRDAAMHLLQVVLSPQGYQKIQEIMGSDQALTDAGTNFSSGAKVYTIGIFGTPSVDKPWMLEFGGHHLALNIVMSGGNGVLTPTLTGAQPSVYTTGGKTVRVLAKENDKAFALLNALDDSQRKQAILAYNIGDLVVGPGHDGEVIMPEGLKASAMTEVQRAMLVDLMSEWTGLMNGAYGKSRLDEVKAGLGDTYFAWSGPTTHKPGQNGSSYYRIQGPKVIIEFSPQGVGGDPTMHVHTIYRDPTNEYGVAFTKPA